MGCHPSHWRTHIFQDGYCTTNQRTVYHYFPTFSYDSPLFLGDFPLKPPTRLNLKTQRCVTYYTYYTILYYSILYESIVDAYCTTNQVEILTRDLQKKRPKSSPGCWIVLVRGSTKRMVPVRMRGQIGGSFQAISGLVKIQKTMEND